MGITTKTGLNENGQSSSVFEGRAIGDIIPHFGTTPPPGTLVCDGSEISREAYKELYKEVGALCGPGDGSTTFNLPDLRDVWLVWAGTQRGAGAKVAEGLPNITGKVLFCSPPDSDINIIRFTEGCFSSAHEEENQAGELAFNHATPPTHRNLLSFNAGNDSAVYGASAHVTPESVAILPCIVYE